MESLLASKGAKEPTAISFTRDDLNRFDLETYYDQLLGTHPTLMHALAGTAMSHQGPENIQVGVI